MLRCLWEWFKTVIFLFLQIRDIKDDVDYYIDNCLEPDFTENDMIYDDIEGLEEMLLDVSARVFVTYHTIQHCGFWRLVIGDPCTICIL